MTIQKVTHEKMVIDQVVDGQYGTGLILSFRGKYIFNVSFENKYSFSVCHATM
jgi:hypothetical protein